MLYANNKIRSEIPRWLLLSALMGVASWGRAVPDRTLTANMPLHLEEHLGQAVVTGSTVPRDVPKPIVWSFDKAQPEWRAFPFRASRFEPMQLTRTDDAVRVILGKSTRKNAKNAAGGLYVDVPDWTLDDWAQVVSSPCGGRPG